MKKPTMLSVPSSAVREAARPYRKTTQTLMPATHTPTAPGDYDIYPGHDIGSGKIGLGFSALAKRLAGNAQVVIDGWVGILWDDLRESLDHALAELGLQANWIDVSRAMLDESEINRRVLPFLGGDDPLFGTRYAGTLTDFFDRERLTKIQPDARHAMNIVYGCGAALAGWKGLLVYVDLPKNEVQFRSRAGVVRNLGQSKPESAKAQYKRFFFVDWVALNLHKAELLPRIDVFVDGQRVNEPAFTEGETMRSALHRLAHTVVRARPWFEPGPWGGSWILEKIPALAREVPNYAWSFELIAPENGIILTSDQRLLEVSFDCLMFQEVGAVLGPFADRYGYYFPIRFDFLDTFDGGNLSIQCHPGPEYIRRHFGETIAQDETYYILDCKPGARVHLGFQKGVDPKEYREALGRSFRESVPVDVPRFVNAVNSAKHDLLLIPSGTVHGSGRDNLVLEISSTPYIFTFKMYDWLRMDLDGTPRPLNIDRAFDNLHFERQGEAIERELISHPRVIAEGTGWRLVHLPTHRDHFLDVHRFEFRGAVEARTEGSPHVMSLVEGSSVVVETTGGERRRFNYAETFVIPAGAECYRLISGDGEPVMVVKAFLKQGREYPL